MIPTSHGPGNAFPLLVQEPEDVMPPLRLQLGRRRALIEHMKRIRREMRIDRRALAAKAAEPRVRHYGNRTVVVPAEKAIPPKWEPWPAAPKRIYRRLAPVILTEQGDPAVSAAILEMLLECREGASL